MGQTLLQIPSQRLELKQLELPALDIPTRHRTLDEDVRLHERDHWFDLQMDGAEADEDQVRFAVLGVVRTLDELLNFGDSFFFEPVAYDRYCNGELDALHLNAASHASPFPEVRRYAERIHQLFECKGAMRPMTREVRSAFLQHVRCQIAADKNLEPHQVVLCRNTTEAARIAAVISNVFTTSDIQREILCTDGIHISVLLHLLLNDDPGNADRKDRFSSWPEYYARRGQQYDPFQTKLGKGEFGMFSVRGQTLEDIKQELDGLLDRYDDARSIGLIVLPHVLRETGAILPIKELCDHIRGKFAFHHKYHLCTKQPFILIDGAQAEGVVPGFRLRFREREDDAEGLDCDGYIASPHKTLHSNVLGLLYLRDLPEFDHDRSTGGKRVMRSSLKGSIARHLQSLQDMRDLPPSVAVILDGMFDPSLGIRANVRDHLDCADAAGYLAAQRVILEREGREPGYTCAHRARLKSIFRDELEQASRRKGTPVIFPEELFPESPFIQSVGFPDADGKAILQSLAHTVFGSWVGEIGMGRFSFGLRNTADEVREAARHIIAAYPPKPNQFNHCQM